MWSKRDVGWPRVILVWERLDPGGAEMQDSKAERQYLDAQVKSLRERYSTLAFTKPETPISRGLPHLYSRFQGPQT
jgi:hypothetical protein